MHRENHNIGRKCKCHIQDTQCNSAQILTSSGQTRVQAKKTNRAIIKYVGQSDRGVITITHQKGF